MSNPDNCPNCNTTLIGDPIPLEDVTNYSGTHWRREIGIYDMGQDRTVAWRCPDCAHEWPVNWLSELTNEAKKKLGL